METDELIELRGHHLRKLGEVYWQGYPDKELTPLQIKVYDCLNELVEHPEQKIILIDTTSDVLCKMCKSRTKLLNGDSEYINEKSCSDKGDAYVAELIGLKLGQTYSIKEILVAIDQNKDNRDFLPLEKAS